MTDKQLTTKGQIIQLMTPVVFPLVRLYWFVFRPHTEGVKVVLHNDEHQLLLVRHTYGSRDWTFPGGSREGEETPKETAKREIREELSVQLQSVEVCGNFTSRKEYKHDHITVCAGRVNDAVTPSPFEIDKAQWLEKDNLPELGSVAKQVLSIYGQSN
jgi:8-oxo-dGTP pyrophosphatase MutT (NUDIX family)